LAAIEAVASTTHRVRGLCGRRAKLPPVVVRLRSRYLLRRGPAGLAVSAPVLKWWEDAMRVPLWPVLAVAAQGTVRTTLR